MKARIRVGDYWLVSEGQWTLNGERATEYESKAAVRRALEWVISAQNPADGRRIEVVVIFN